jgi:hypothetical protein
MDTPLFIVGTERSGSNLLRLVLDAHPRLFVPHPPHVMHFFGPLEARYGDLSREPALRRLTADVLRLVEGHIHRWDHIPSVDSVVARAPTRDLFGVMAGLYEAAREHAGKPRWGNKSTFMVHHAGRVLKAYPAARFLWLVRDPRDVAVSSRESVFSPFHPLRTATLWARQQAEGARLERDWPEHVLRVHYEALVGEPEATVARICGFLGEEPDPAMLAFHRRPAAQRSASLSESWARTGQPIEANRVGRWEGALSALELAQVEVTAAEPMRLLGYDRHTDAGTEVLPGPLGEARVTARDRLDWLRVEARSLRRDRNVWQRWGRWALMRRIALERAVDPAGAAGPR